MIRLEKVNQNTFYKVIEMKVLPEQKNYVASNIYSLAQAWLYYDNALPFAILNDDEVVGFVMLDWDKYERVVSLWRFMIDPIHQKKGYGRKVTEEIIRMAKESPDIDFIALDYVIGNEVAKNLYYSLGFRETGEVDDGEIIMILPLTDNPGVGVSKSDESDLDDIIALMNEDSFNNINKDEIKDLVLEEKLVRLSLIGKTIGIMYNNEILLSKEYIKYLEEAKIRVSEYLNR